MPFVLLPILLVMLVFLLITTRKPKGTGLREAPKSDDRRNQK